MNETNIQNFPPSWASAWGEDAYGIFADLMINDNPEITQRFRLIAAGEFMMGSLEQETERISWENQHKVTLTKNYWLADTTVTQAFWQAIMENNPAHFSDDLNNPVEKVNWNDAQEFIQKLNQQFQTDLGEDVIRLPTEAEWEHACRAGTETPFSLGENITPEQVNYDGGYPYHNGEKGGYREKTVKVKTFPPNSWGLYEMHGNLWEWCADAWQEQLGELAVVDPFNDNSDSSANRVVRGGSWIDGGKSVRSAYRDHNSPVSRVNRIGLRFSLGHELHGAKRKQER